ncbi:tetratricopeptide repeat protein [Ottowia thiooxydans]|uniref:Flp pilus assembly protein TadD n=1 Tax=Ottowia thiooxydans TaxID=219182 RepID=A0ABV2QGV2_9BURK
MSTASSLPDSSDIHLLTEIGFLASARGDVARAEPIFRALLLLRPEKAFPHVGLATALMNARRAGDAATHLATASLPPGEDSDMVQAMHGLALQLDGRISQSQRVLREVAKQADRPEGTSDGTRLARKLLGQDAMGTA